MSQEDQRILVGILASSLMDLSRRKWRIIIPLPSNDFKNYCDFHLQVLVSVKLSVNYLTRCFGVYYRCVFLQVVLYFLSRYAEMPPETKNSISHRGKALSALKEYFESTLATNDDKCNGEPANKKPKISGDKA